MEEMKPLRKKINDIDERIVELLGNRINFSKEIGQHKLHAGLPIFDKQREKQVKKLWGKKADEIGIDYNSIYKILDEILHMSREEQRILRKQ